jgi:hypothetical protein
MLAANFNIKRQQQQKQMNGFLAAQNDMGFKGFDREQATAKTNANAGVLRFAQNDRLLVVGLIEEQATASANTKTNAGGSSPFDFAQGQSDKFL